MYLTLPNLKEFDINGNAVNIFPAPNQAHPDRRRYGTIIEPSCNRKNRPISGIEGAAQTRQRRILRNIQRDQLIVAAVQRSQRRILGDIQRSQLIVPAVQTCQSRILGDIQRGQLILAAFQPRQCREKLDTLQRGNSFTRNIYLRNIPNLLISNIICISNITAPL